LNPAIPCYLNIEPILSKELAFKRQCDLTWALCGDWVKIIPRITYCASGISLCVACGAVGDCTYANCRVRDAHGSAILNVKGETWLTLVAETRVVITTTAI
jgi:hypothetical protein